MADEVQNFVNNSGEGANAQVPEAIAKQFNWGVFLLNWIWGLGNNTYITFVIFAVSLLSFIPLIGWLAPLGCSIWFGLKGNEWAWQNKKWDSIEHFENVQKTWAKAGVVLLIVGAVLGFILGIFIILAAGIAAGMAK